MRARSLLAPFVLLAPGCGGAAPASDARPAMTVPVASVDASAPSPSASVEPAADASAPPPESCEGAKHLATPAAGHGNDVPFTAAFASVRSRSRSAYATLDLELGTHADRFVGGEAYRGASVHVIADAPSFTIVPGTYPIPSREKNGPMASAMIEVSGSVGLGNNARGEVIIEEISAAKGRSPATVRGKLWICVDPIAEYPGPQWLGGTFVAEVKPLDTLYKVPAAFKVEPGRIVATRPTRR